MLAVTLALAVVATAFGGSAADRLVPFNAIDPESESVTAKQRVEQAIGFEPDAAVIAIVRSDGSVRSAAVRARVERITNRIFFDPAVAWVTNYYGSGDGSMVSENGRSTYILANFKPTSDKAKEKASRRLVEQLSSEKGVTIGGYGPGFAEFSDTAEDEIGQARRFVYPALFLVALWFFRSLVAAALPVLVGGLTIITTLLVLRIATELTSISTAVLYLVGGLGLGLAIDYSLLIVSRYREETARAGATGQALRQTLATAGRTVLFSSLTIAAALASLLVFPQHALYSMAIGGIVVALVACAVSLLVLPATLALLGERVNALAPRRLQRAATKDARPASSGAWYRLSRFVTRRPARIAAASAALLITLGIPFHAIKFTASDASVLPQNSSVGHAYDVLESEFPPHRTEPIFLAIRAPAGKRVDDFADKLRRLPGVAQVKPPRPVSDRASLLEVVSNGRVLSGQSQDLVDEIRSLPTSLDIAVGGFTATFVDQKSSLSHHLPFAVAIVTTLTILLLFLMTGSLVLPLKALIMNLLTLSAVFGILVFVFQGGRLEGLLDYTGQGALDLTLPILLFAVAFGLATDYGVFLLTRIKEVRDSGVQDTEAVAIGLERTGRIVTSAALLFCVAVSVLVASQIVTIKQVGVGIMLAVLIDATIVRAFLVPSLMRLLGSWNWWAPAPLRRLHRRLRLV